MRYHGEVELKNRIEVKQLESMNCKRNAATLQDELQYIAVVAPDSCCEVFDIAANPDDALSGIDAPGKDVAKLITETRRQETDATGLVFEAYQ